MKINFAQKQLEIIRVYDKLASLSIQTDRKFTEDEIALSIQSQVPEFKDLDSEKTKKLHSVLQEYCLGSATYTEALHSIVKFKKKEILYREKMQDYGFEEYDDMAKAKAVDDFLKVENKKRKKLAERQKQLDEQIKINNVDKYLENQNFMFFSPVFRTINSTDKLLSNNQYSVRDIPNKVATIASKLLFLNKMNDFYCDCLGKHKEQVVIPAARKRLRNHCLKFFNERNFNDERIKRQLNQTFKFLGIEDEGEKKELRKQIKEDCFDKIIFDTSALLHKGAGKLEKGKSYNSIENQMRVLENYKATFRKDFSIEQMQKIEQLERIYQNSKVTGTNELERKERLKKERKARRKLN